MTLPPARSRGLARGPAAKIALGAAGNNRPPRVGDTEPPARSPGVKPDLFCFWNEFERALQNFGKGTKGEIARGQGGGGSQVLKITPKLPAFSRAPGQGRGSVRRSMKMRGRLTKSSKTRLVGLTRAGCSCMRSARRLQRPSRALKQDYDLVAALGAVRAEEDRLGASRITSCGYFLQFERGPTLGRGAGKGKCVYVPAPGRPPSSRAGGRASNLKPSCATGSAARPPAPPPPPAPRVTLLSSATGSNQIPAQRRAHPK